MATTAAHSDVQILDQNCCRMPFCVDRALQNASQTRQYETLYVLARSLLASVDRPAVWYASRNYCRFGRESLGLAASECISHTDRRTAISGIGNYTRSAKVGPLSSIQLTEFTTDGRISYENAIPSRRIPSLSGSRPTALFEGWFCRDG